jgi:hypothetical protein
MKLEVAVNTVTVAPVLMDAEQVPVVIPPALVQTIPPGLAPTVPSPVVIFVVKVNVFNGFANSAVTFMFLVMNKTHPVPVPVQSPPHLTKFPPVIFKLRLAPALYDLLQVVPQFIPVGLLVTIPVLAPAPVLDTVRVNAACAVLVGIKIPNPKKIKHVRSIFLGKVWGIGGVKMLH